MADIRNRIKEVKQIRFGDVKEHPRNPKTHPANQRAAFRGSVAELGFVSVPLAYYSDRYSKDGIKQLVWVDGHLRGSETAEYTGDVAILDIDDAEADKLLLYADPIAAMAEYESQQLDSLLRDVQTGDEALQKMLASLAVEAGLYPDKPTVADPGPQIDKAEELRKKWDVSSGDMFQLGRDRLICGDCTDKATVERVMQGEKADSLLIDPPYGDLIIFNKDRTVGKSNAVKVKNYGQHYQGEGDFDSAPVLEITKNYADKMVIWGGNYFTNLLPPRTDWLVWDKRAGEHSWFSDCELAWTNLGIVAKIFSFTWQGMIRAGEKVERMHPTQKPVELMNWVLGELAKDAKIVLDCFSGSGVVLLSCEQLGRQCRAVEISAAYCAVALERWSIATNAQPVRAA